MSYKNELKVVKLEFSCEEDARHFMSWMHHYGYLEFQSWLEDSNSAMLELRTDWETYTIKAIDKN